MKIVKPTQKIGTRVSDLAPDELVIGAQKGELAFSLIEMIGVMTVLALLALALTPILVKQYDRIAGDKEAAQLKAFAQAFKQGIRTTRIIPVPGNWASMISSNMGLSDSQVLINDRRIGRVFIVDPNIRIGTGLNTASANPNNSLPFNNNANFNPTGSEIKDAYGNTVPPVNPRAMFISSISQPLTAFTINGHVLGSLTGSDFDSLWSVNDGSLPSGTAWNGKPDDLKVQRVHLGDIFVQVILNNQNADNPAYFSIDQQQDVVNPSTSVWRFYIDGTQLCLYTNDTVSGNVILQYTEILHDARSFLSDLDWKIGGYVGPRIHHPDSFDMDLVADAFFNSPPNPAAQPLNTPPNVWGDMVSYMSNYWNWANGGYAPAFKTPLDNAQSILANDTSDAISRPGCTK